MEIIIYLLGCASNDKKGYSAEDREKEKSADRRDEKGNCDHQDVFQGTESKGHYNICPDNGSWRRVYPGSEPDHDDRNQTEYHRSKNDECGDSDKFPQEIRSARHGQAQNAECKPPLNVFPDGCSTEKYREKQKGERDERQRERYRQLRHLPHRKRTDGWDEGKQNSGHHNSSEDPVAQNAFKCHQEYLQHVESP